jgi:hypothetical protein
MGASPPGAAILTTGAFMKSALFLLPALALTACVSGGNNNISVPATPAPNPPAANYPAPQQPPIVGGATHFDCENGLGVNIRNLSVNQIELRLDDKTAILNNAVAASGERYVSNSGLFGRGAEWHQKGSEAFFAFTDPYGNKVETSCRSGIIRN